MDHGWKNTGFGGKSQSASHIHGHLLLRMGYHYITILYKLMGSGAFTRLGSILLGYNEDPLHRKHNSKSILA